MVSVLPKKVVDIQKKKKPCTFATKLLSLLDNEKCWHPFTVSREMSFFSNRGLVTITNVAQQKRLN